MKMGNERLSFYGDKFASVKTGIDCRQRTGHAFRIPGEPLHRKWYAGETISVAIGQGAITTTLFSSPPHRRHRFRRRLQAAPYA
jgi:hypothetical protein